jgi:hypothetical protein
MSTTRRVLPLELSEVEFDAWVRDVMRYPVSHARGVVEQPPPPQRAATPPLLRMLEHGRDASARTPCSTPRRLTPSSGVTPTSVWVDDEEHDDVSDPEDDGRKLDDAPPRRLHRARRRRRRRMPRRSTFSRLWREDPSEWDTPETYRVRDNVVEMTWEMHPGTPKMHRLSHLRMPWTAT